MSGPKLEDHKWLPLLAVCLGSFMLLVDVTVINVALPDMAVDLDASFSDLQWIFNVYAIVIAALLLGVGALADRHGHRVVYLGGLILFALASLCSGLAPGIAELIVARVFQGAGAAAMFATTISLINSSYSGRERGLAFGAWGAVNGAAAASGPIVGGLLITWLSWRWIFFINLPISAAALALGLRVLPRAGGRGGARLDLSGIAAFSVFAGALTYALTCAPESGWTAPSTLGLLALAALAALTFVAAEMRGTNPIFDLGLLRRPAFSGTMIAALLLSTAAFAAAPVLSLWLQSVNGMSAIAAGLALAPLSIASLLTALALGRVMHRLPPRLPIAAGLALVGAGDLLQAHLGASSGWTALVPGLTLAGIGVGLVTPTLASAALASVPLDRSGMAAGAVNTMRQLGFALGIAMLGAIAQAQMGTKLAAAGVSTDDAAEKLIGGQAQVLLASAKSSRVALDAAIHASFASALNAALLVAGVVGIVGAALSAVLLRPAHEATTRSAGSRSSPAVAEHPTGTCSCPRVGVRIRPID